VFGESDQTLTMDLAKSSPVARRGEHDFFSINQITHSRHFATGGAKMASQKGTTSLKQNNIY
jgi:hypothetical protein